VSDSAKVLERNEGSGGNSPSRDQTKRQEKAVEWVLKVASRASIGKREENIREKGELCRQRNPHQSLMIAGVS